MKDETQTYKVNFGHLPELFPGIITMAYGGAELYHLDALRPYSSSGKSALFDINTCYNDDDVLHPFEIQGYSGPVDNEPECTGLTGGAICVTVPANSFGYFTIPVYTAPREGPMMHEDLVTLHPNPTVDAFYIEWTGLTKPEENFIVEVLDVQGNHLFTTLAAPEQPVNTKQLPSGLYYIVISNKTNALFTTKKLVKIE